METARPLASDPEVVRRILEHIDRGTTDLGEAVWREPVEHYVSPARFAAERERVLRRRPVPLCPSAALPLPGSYVARQAAGVALLAVRGADGRVRTFRNACRHRGARVAAGSGCGKAFVCRYHGWTYGLDGALLHVPHEHGFPGLDPASRGLVPVATAERRGLVFVDQEGTGSSRAAQLDELPDLIPSDYRLAGVQEQELPVNWKILVESFLEGYHIRTTHAETFYPVQFDNLNVVEHFGPNSRIAYPYRAIHRERAVPAAERSAEGKLTYVYHLFPNVLVATFPGRIFAVVIEPLAVDRTSQTTYALVHGDLEEKASEASPRSEPDLIDLGAAEDQEAVRAVQQGLASGANEFFEFGLCESAAAHFHRALQAALAA